MKTQKSAPPKKKKMACCVVGIGASAGGLEALRSLFGALQPTKSLSFVVVQHLSPVHRSRLVELVGHSTNLKVEEARHGASPRAGTVYITPPNSDVMLESGKLRLSKPSADHGPKPSVDRFFRSLAEDAGDAAVGVILSGTGSDGSLGIRAIKSVGGVTISQKTDSAKYDGMPKSAVNTGSIDLELSPEEIAAELARIDRLARGESRVSPPDSPTNDPYREILAVLSKQNGVNFVQYKQSTIRRRIERRIFATRSATPRDYLEFLAKHPNETTNLVQDILISVTSFFRDADSFRRLSQLVSTQLKRKPRQAYRAWVVGCATGEEAYSVAITLLEAVEKLKIEVRLQVFATDLDENALEIARKGVYPQTAFLDFPAGWREKYFHAKEENFQVKGVLRDLVVFARHNATEDPPFLNIDLLTCRNVMIYFNAALQERTLRTFQYALKKRGLLFLGRSETVPSTNHHFTVLEKHHRFYERGDSKAEPRLEPSKPLTKAEPGAPARVVAPSREDDLFRSLISVFAEDSLLVDETYLVKHVYGQAGVYLRLPAGQVTQDATRMVPPSLGYEMSSLLRQCAKTGKAETGRVHQLRAGGKRVNVRLVVGPLVAAGRRTFIVAFRKEAASKAITVNAKISKGDHSKMGEIQRELLSTREHLQTVIEEQETSNEELQALNEELQSANEELQSSNEELETTNEELQSTNEELITLNEEVNVKSAELGATNLELQATQNAISYPVLTINKKKQLLRFNPAAKFLFRFTEAHQGSPLATAVDNVEFTPVLRLIEKALKQDAESRERFQMLGRHFEIQVQPLRNPRGETEGAVLSFVENTEIVIALEENRMNRDRLSGILENTLAMVSMKDVGGVYLYANRCFYDAISKTPNDVIGATDEEIFGKEAGREWRDRDLQVLKERKALQSEEALQMGEKVRHLSSSRFPLFDRNDRVQSLCTVSIDISDKVASQLVLSDQQDELTRLGRFAALAEISAGIAHEVNTPLNVITTKTDMLRTLANRNRLEAPSITRLADDVDRMAKNISSIVLGLKALSGSEPDKIEDADLNQVVRDTLKICEFRVQRFSIGVSFKPLSRPAITNCFPVQVIQVLTNLINNSVDAIKGSKERWIKIQLTETDQEFALRVTDSGPGIPAAIAEKVMTPFFTTKKAEQGTGIGLSLSRSIARRHGGDLILDGANMNTSFVLTVPKTAKEQA